MVTVHEFKKDMYDAEQLLSKAYTDLKDLAENSPKSFVSWDDSENPKKVTIEKIFHYFHQVSKALENLKMILYQGLVMTPDLDAVAALAAQYDRSGDHEFQKQAVLIDNFLLELAGENTKIRDLEFLVSMASELDKTGDPILMKEASVLDQILLTFGKPQNALEAFKKAEEAEIDRLRAKYREEAREQAYNKSKNESDKDIKVADVVKAIQDQVKEYRPLEAALSTRTCPDHPGAQIARIGDCTYQCSLDKQIYNYQGGFKTMKGNSVPGGDVSGQTQALNDRPMEHFQFDTRESKLNP